MSKAGSEEREDFLNEDTEIPGQKFCLLSFLSPEKVLAKKEVFVFDKFLQQYEFNLRIRNLEGFLASTLQTINNRLDERAVEFDKQDLSGCADLCRNSRLRVDTVIDSLQAFVKENEASMKDSKLREAYDDWVATNKVKLEDEFFAKNDFRTTVRGLKVRGVYGSRAEAEARSKKLQRNDPLHNIFLGEIGKWLPWDPAPMDVPEQEYAEEQLNTLMKKYKENEDAREVFMRENRNRMRGGAAVKATVVPNEDAPTAAEGSPAPAEFNAMFNGPADLAIQRKMEKKD
jgi:hypothetical protein